MSIPFTECSCGCDGKRKQEREGIKRPDTAVMPPVVLSDRHQHSGVKAARIVHKTKLLEQIEGSQMHWRVSATTTYQEELDVTKAVDELWRIEGERKLRGDGMMQDCLFGTLQTGMSTESNHLRISHSKACHNNGRSSSVLVKTHSEVLDLTTVTQPSHNGAHTMVHIT
ncbi:hypothetical protein BDL97_01G204300 [Sphagnum fallax]|nr:hypothetical protein BDL97_01G204300 [Sphagnum fallax]